MTRMSLAAQKAIFDELGSLAEIEAMPEPDRSQYEESLRVYRDNLAVMRCERKEGFKEGKLEIAKKLKRFGVDTETICKLTGLAPAEVEKL